MKREIRQLLTKRQLQVLRLINKGYTSAQIALSLGISKLTVGVHRKHIMQKTDCHGVWDIVNYCKKHNIR